MFPSSCGSSDHQEATHQDSEQQMPVRSPGKPLSHAGMRLCNQLPGKEAPSSQDAPSLTLSSVQ